jgi:hypothetical protein
MLDLLHPTCCPTPASQKFCCIFYARFFVRRSTNRSEISSVNKRMKKKFLELNHINAVVCCVKRCWMEAQHITYYYVMFFFIIIQF